MPKPSATTTLPPHSTERPYLNEQTVRDLRHQAQRKHPDAETIELDATNADHYAFDEAVSPSLLSERSIVIVSNLQNADDKLGETMVATASKPSTIQPKPASSSANTKAASKANDSSTNSPKPEPSKKP